MAQDGLVGFEPTFINELATVLRFSFDYIQRSGEDRA
jgi:pyruvate dehydrogenase E1 component